LPTSKKWTKDTGNEIFDRLCCHYYYYYYH
jgi:hypothetical protein